MPWRLGGVLLRPVRVCLTYGRAVFLINKGLSDMRGAVWSRPWWTRPSRGRRRGGTGLDIHGSVSRGLLPSSGVPVDCVFDGFESRKSECQMGERRAALRLILPGPDPLEGREAEGRRYSQWPFTIPTMSSTYPAARSSILRSRSESPRR